VEDVTARHTAPAPRRFAVHPRDAGFVLVAVAVVALDQFTKWIIRQEIEYGTAIWDLGFFRLVHITNSGAAFGMLQGAGPLLVVTSVIGGAAIVVFLFNPGFAHPLMRVGLALMLGGAIGNLIDRVRVGEVVDFLKVPNFPAFNVADSAITIGVVALLWTLLMQENEPSKSTD
jgi:signal peptidase II